MDLDNFEDSNLNTHSDTIDNKNSPDQNSYEEEIEKSIERNLDDMDNMYCNFLVNASNQANLANASNTTHAQINAIFILIAPYYIDACTLEGLNLDIKMDSNGNITVNDMAYKAVEVKPGISVFGISKQE